MGNLTVGIGHVLKAGGIAFPGRAIEALFDEDFLVAESHLESLMDIDFDLHYKDIEGFTPKRIAALIEMCFQLGASRLRRFVRMFGAIKEGDWAEAAREALDSRWADQTPGRAKRIAAVLRGPKRRS